MLEAEELSGFLRLSCASQEVVKDEAQEWNADVMCTSELCHVRDSHSPQSLILYTFSLGRIFDVDSADLQKGLPVCRSMWGLNER